MIANWLVLVTLVFFAGGIITLIIRTVERLEHGRKKQKH